jgi:transposase InsO family protein
VEQLLPRVGQTVMINDPATFMNGSKPSFEHYNQKYPHRALKYLLPTLKHPKMKNILSRF